jgi:hypothetical protein
MSLPFYGGLYLASLLADYLGQSHLEWAAPGAALGVGIAAFVLFQLFAWLLRGRLGRQDQSAKIEVFTGQEVKALADAQELFANAHYDLAVMEVHRALDARLRRVLLGRKSNLPDGDLDALVAAAKRAGILREPALTLFKDLDRQWHIALSSEPLTKEGAAVALSATRHILATIPVPEPVAAGSGKTV